MTSTQLLYFNDNYSTDFSSSVTDIDEVNNTITLESTLFYPRGGNQNSDSGVLMYGERQLKVVRVAKDKATDEVVHYIDEKDTNKLSEVEIGNTVQGKIDWDKRYEHMKVHTSQHLLSSLFSGMFQAETLDVEITKDYGEIKLDKDLRYSEILDVQDKANSLISEGGTQTQRSLINGRYHLSIGDVDNRECGGTHVEQLSEIEKVVIFKVESRKVFYAVGKNADAESKQIQIDALTLQSLYPSNVENVSEFKEYLRGLQIDHSSLKEDLYNASKDLLSINLSSPGTKVNGHNIFVSNVQALTTKEVKSIVDNTDINNDSFIVILCRKNSLLIKSTSQSLQAGQFMSFLKTLDQNIKGGGNQQFSQGGPWGEPFSKLEEAIFNFVETKED